MGKRLVAYAVKIQQSDSGRDLIQPDSSINSGNYSAEFKRNLTVCPTRVILGGSDTRTADFQARMGADSAV